MPSELPRANTHPAVRHGIFPDFKHPLERVVARAVSRKPRSGLRGTVVTDRKILPARNPIGKIPNTPLDHSAEGLHPHHIRKHVVSKPRRPVRSPTRVGLAVCIHPAIARSSLGSRWIGRIIVSEIRGPQANRIFWIRHIEHTHLQVRSRPRPDAFLPRNQPSIQIIQRHRPSQLLRAIVDRVTQQSSRRLRARSIHIPARSSWGLGLQWINNREKNNPQ